MTESHNFFDEQRWFVVDDLGDNVFCIGEPLHFEDVRSFLVLGSERALLIDTGMGIGDIRAVVGQLTSLPVLVANSHSHWDHIGGNWQLDEIAIHPLEAKWLDSPESTDALRNACSPEKLYGSLPAGVVVEDLSIRPSIPTRFLNEGDRIELGNRTLEVLLLPGHCPGLLGFLERDTGILFSTDVVYPGNLYAYSEESNLDDYLDSLTRLAGLAPVLRHVYPSHYGNEMPASLLEPMRSAMAEVIAGRAPDAVDELRATHRFDGFGIYAPVAHLGAMVR